MPDDYFDIPEEFDERPQPTHPGQHQQYPHGYPAPGGYHYVPYAQGPHYFGQNMPYMFPPNYIPRRPRFHPGSIRTCVNRFTYVWLNDGRNFWTWIPTVSRRTIHGYRWTGSRWVYFEADVNDVDTFACG